MAAAHGRDVLVAGGARTVQQYLRARLIDEFEIHAVPVLLASGERLFDKLADGPAGYEFIGPESSPEVAHYSYSRKAGQ